MQQLVQIQHTRYYIFETKEWVICTSGTSLPYSLVEYTIPGGRKIIALPNSYRIMYQLSDTLIGTSHELMCQEKKWRDSLIIGDEIDCQTHKGWVKAEIINIKCDITPRVLDVVPRGSATKNSIFVPMVSGFGYIHQDSRKFAKSCTHTPKITEQQLCQEKKIKQRIEQDRKKKEKWFNDWGKTHTKWKVFGKTNEFYNPLEYYITLRKNHTNWSDKAIIDLCIHDRKQNINMSYLSTLTTVKRLIFPMTIKDCDVCFKTKSYTVKDESIVMLNSDAICNIRVFEANKAVLLLRHSSIRIELKKIKGVHTLPDITYDNPLFPMVGMDDPFEIETDGKYATMDHIFITVDKYVKFCQISSIWAISMFPSCQSMLIAHHMGGTVHMVPLYNVERIFAIPHKIYKSLHEWMQDNKVQGPHHIATQFFRTLRKNPIKWTMNTIRALDQEINGCVSKALIPSSDISFLQMVYPMIHKKRFDVFYTPTTKPIKNGMYMFPIRIADGFCDIKIYNASDATLYDTGIGNFYIDFKKVDNYLTIDFIDCNNPLLQSSQQNLMIETDGDTIQYDQIFLNIDHCRVLNACLGDSFVYPIQA